MQRNILIIGSNGYVSAIAADSGDEVWRTKLRDGLMGGSYGAVVSVLLDNDKIFAGCSGRIYCLDSLTGKILWNNDLKGMGYNVISLARPGISTQFITKVETSNAG
ncbi:MAG: PQQ-binding-like beta-propeller repeat protein [Chitinophagaceae bacterium]